jgi:beta-glucuronidase
MKKIFLCSLVAAMAWGAQAQDVSLDGEWQLSINNKDYKVIVPHTYNVMDGLEDYAGEAVYRRPLPITQEMKGKTVRIHFGAVYHDAEVYVNGRKVGEHLNKGYTPFSFDITTALTFSGTDMLEVRTSNAYTAKGLPYMRSFDWSNDGGIYRSVKLHVSGKHTLRYVHVMPGTDGNTRFSIRLYNEGTNRLKGHLTIINRQTGHKVYDARLNLSKKNTDRQFTTSVLIRNPQLWHFDHPNLYDFIFEIPGSDFMSGHFGFRSFRTEGHSFVLNGEKVRLPGIEDMPGSNPEFGMAEPDAFIKKTVSMMKDMNTTITRFHWQQDEKMLTAMDEAGILVTEQIPWWQKPAPALTPELRQNAREQLEEMIEAHYNHPCIFAWGLANEVWGCQDDLSYLREVAGKMDSTRKYIAFSHETYKNLEKNPSCLLDIPTWNEYTGTWHGNNREELATRLAKIDSALAGRPLLITEAGLCEPAFTGGDGRRTDDMIYHVKEWQAADFIPGYIYFCMQDYRTQMGEEGLGKWRIRRHGVTKTNLTPKASYHILRQLMSPIEITEVYPADSKRTGDALSGQIEIDANDNDASVTLHVKNSIPAYTLHGYVLRYENANGHAEAINLPVMEPGKSYRLRLKNINHRYKFSVLRPNGFSTIDY